MAQNAFYDYNPKMVWVSNNNKFDHLDRWNGIPFKFPAGKRVKCHLVAADHFFAVNARTVLFEAQKHPELADALRKAEEQWQLEKARVLTRNRWNVEENGQRRKDGDAILDAFHFEAVVEATAAQTGFSAA